MKSTLIPFNHLHEITQCSHEIAYFLEMIYSKFIKNLLLESLNGNANAVFWK